MSIASNIKFLRESKNMTQVEFGKIAGVTDRAVSTWENGTAEPRMGAIQKIADYFGISKGWIVDNDLASSSSIDISLFMEDDEKSLLDMYRSLNSIGKDKVLEYLSDLNDNDKYKKDSQCGRKAG